MTRGDAINGFKKDIKLMEGYGYETVIERFNIAIRSLEAWDKVVEESKEKTMRSGGQYRNGMIEINKIIKKFLQEVEK